MKSQAVRYYNRLGNTSQSYEELCGILGYDIFDSIPDWEEFPNLLANKNKLVDLFNLHYSCKKLGYEIYGEFYRHLRLTFQELAAGYNILYDKYKNDIDRLLLVGDVTIRDYEELSSLSSSQSLNSDASSNFYDTPKTNIPDPLNKPSTITTNDGSQTTDGKSNSTVSRKENEQKTSRGYADEVNRLRYQYLNLNNEFIKEFRNLFLGITILD